MHLILGCLLFEPGILNRSLHVCVSVHVFFLAATLSLLRWCTVSDQELAKCSDMSKAFSRANLFPELACVNGGSVIGCISMINVSMKYLLLDLQGEGRTV